MDAQTERLGRARALYAFRSRDFRLLWSARTVSLVGDGAFLIALGWRTTTLTGSATSLAIVLMAHSVALLATVLVGGALADRYSRRMLMIASDLARVAIMGALALLDASGELSFGLLLALAVGFGLADGFFYPAAGGIVPLVVEPHELASANTLIGISRQASFVVGPALAGSIYGIAGSEAVFGLNAVTFLVSAALLVPARPRSFEREPSEGTLRSIAEGVRYVAGVPWLWVGIVVTSVVLMVAMAPFQALAPTFVAEQFGKGVGAYGLLFAFEAAGMTIGMIVFGQVNPRTHRIWQIFGFLALNDVFAVVMTLQESYGVAVTLMVVRGVLIGYAIGIWATLMMEWVPEGKLARVTSLDFFGALGLVPVGYALTALVSQTAEASTILTVGFTLAGLGWALPLFVHRVRTAA
ncbi:MAG TPA: MFS transporter [Gaiellaceae bacterium]|nr:MFS transporter [Gaiellaceae bacterium]